MVGHHQNRDTSDYKWWIPITFTTESEAVFNNTLPKMWLNPTSTGPFTEQVPDEETWVIFNVGWTGFYRVNYDAENWQALAMQLATDHLRISVQNRAQIIDDAANLAKAGNPFDYE